MSVQNLTESRIYKIVGFKEVNTKFGQSYILTDSNCKKYWANKKIADFIKRNGIRASSDNSRILFRVNTGEYKSFTNSDGEEIRFLEMIITLK